MSRFGKAFLAGVMIFAPSIGSVAVAEAQTPIRIGASASKTGAYAALSQKQVRGYQLCIKHTNEKGGVLGRKLELVVEDDQSQAATVIRIYERLITEETVDLVLGPYGSPMAELVANVTESDYVKSNPGKVWASGSAKGGSWDLARAGMLKTAGSPVDAMPYVPSTGAATALQELVAGRVQVVTASLVEGRPLIDAGKVRALATMAEKRDPAFPNVPTLKELGLNYSMGAWRGIALPKGTSPEIVAV
jgi:hypothetical protein